MSIEKKPHKLTFKFLNRVIEIIGQSNLPFRKAKLSFRQLLLSVFLLFFKRSNHLSYLDFEFSW